MVDLEYLEMADLGENDQFDFEGLDGEGGLFEEEYDGFDPEGYLFEGGLDPEGTDFESWTTSFETSDLEADPFLGNLIKNATRKIARNVPGGIGPQFLRQLAQQAAQVAGGAVAGQTGANIATKVAGQVLREGDLESETWYETDATMEMEGDPGLMEELHYNAAMAAESSSDQEADPFIGAIANLAGPLLTSVMGESAADPLYEDGFADGEDGYLGERDEFLPALIPLAAPLISRGIGALGTLFSKSSKTRRFTRALPEVAAETARDLGRLGRRPTSRDVAATMALGTTRLLGNPTTLSRAMRQNRVIAARAQTRPATAGGMAPRSQGQGRMRRSGIIYSDAMPSQQPGRRVVGYVLRPIYSGTRVRG
jgi:hypothetical protein